MAHASTPQERRLQRSWYWYDWAVTGYLTVSITVLFGPYVTSVANRAACPTQPADQDCQNTLSVLGLGIAPGSLVPFTTTVATILAAIAIVFFGSYADRAKRPTRMLGALALVGSLCAMAMCLITGTRWQLACLLLIATTVAMIASLTIYNAIMCRITPPDDRDRVSTTGWAFGYASGGLLLALSLGVVQAPGTFGLDTSTAVRIIFFVAGLWWLVFSLPTVVRLDHLPAMSEGTSGSSLTQLRRTFAELRSYPQTWRFLIAYLFFNDGVQTVIAAATIYGKFQLKLSESQLIITILLVQFVAFGGALAFGRLARRFPAKQVVLASLAWWTVVLIAAFFLPARNFPLWLVLAVAIGLVLGGSQSLSRSLYSHLIPHGKEAEFFSLYQAMERGTSWLGTFVFGLVYQVFHDYRLSIIALVIFFAVGGLLLRRVDVRRGIADVGNVAPRIV
ncbi:MFS transporter [Calidifontibacter sp. DB0510]|uniref:MFS transporter n=1 Tax=Metallococcus carri TaxID=1656884 RepID=A0A967AYJ6_9MICO|nr:MFS transporter [Metallococcus carri]NOP37134.1 MFS transporter [Calidifontibacter sp. DB2511S]